MPKTKNSKIRINSLLTSSSDEDLDFDAALLPRPRPQPGTSRVNASQSPIRGHQSMRSSKASSGKIVLSPTDDELEEVPAAESTVQPMQAAPEPEPCSCHQLLRKIRAEQEKQQEQFEELRLQVRNQQVKMRKLKNFLRDWTLDID